MGKHFIHNLKEGFWADLLISVNPIEFGRIAFKYFPNEANQLMINANISITDYFSLIESYPGLGNAYLSNLKNTLMNMGYTAAGWTYLADEHHIYGSSRVGVHNTHFVLAKRFSTAEMEYTQKTGNQVHFIRGKRNYELSNHLGNVQVVISDKRISVCDNELQTERFEADILMATDYYPFGMAIPERQWYTGSDSSNYRYGFGGHEKDEEVKGAGNHVSFGDYGYDSRLGKRFRTDPLQIYMPALTPYNYSLNNPIMFVDEDGNYPGVTYWFFELDLGGGIGYGFNYVEQSGIAFDEVGKTHFIMTSKINVWNQNLQDGSRNPEVVGGFSVSLSGGFTQDWSNETFLGDITGYNGELAGLEVYPGVGGQIGFGTQRVTLKIGIGFGVKISVINTQVKESISLTDKEAEFVSDATDVVTESWLVKDKYYDADADLWYATVATKNTKGELIDTGIKISSANVVDDDGYNVPSGVWTSESYREEATKAEEQ